MCQWDSKRTSWLTAGTEPGHPGRRSPALGVRKIRHSGHYKLRLSLFYSRLRDVTIAEITSKDDGVKAGFAPELHEVNDVPEAQRGVTGENHAGLTELTAEVSVDAGVVLQLVGLDELKQQQHI